MFFPLFFLNVFYFLLHFHQCRSRHLSESFFFLFGICLHGSDIVKNRLLELRNFLPMFRVSQLADARVQRNCAIFMYNVVQQSKLASFFCKSICLVHAVAVVNFPRPLSDYDPSFTHPHSPNFWMRGKFFSWICLQGLFFLFQPIADLRLEFVQQGGIGHLINLLLVSDVTLTGSLLKALNILILEGCILKFFSFMAFLLFFVSVADLWHASLCASVNYVCLCAPSESYVERGLDIYLIRRFSWYGSSSHGLHPTDFVTL